jgi:hypothetical protein
MEFNFVDFECSYSDESDPDYHSISYKGEELLIIRKLDLQIDTLYCDFDLPSTQLNIEDIETIVRIVVLQDFELNFYKDKAKYLKLLNKGTGKQWTVTLNV